MYFLKNVPTFLICDYDCFIFVKEFVWAYCILNFRCLRKHNSKHFHSPFSDAITLRVRLKKEIWKCVRKYLYGAVIVALIVLKVSWYFYETVALIRAETSVFYISRLFHNIFLWSIYLYIFICTHLSRQKFNINFMTRVYSYLQNFLNLSGQNIFQKYLFSTW